MTDAVRARSPQSFAALRHPGFRAYFIRNSLTMMADSIEHVISYWIIFQKFHSPALGGFAIVSHWLPMLLFGVSIGALADRIDPRRLIQIGMLCFMSASLTWSMLFMTDSLQMWHAAVILIVHGMGSLFWNTPSQILIHDIVGPEELPSAVRLIATGRYLGLLAGPAVGGGILLLLGPSHGLLLNVLFYVPLLLWLWKAPYGPRFRASGPAPRRAIRGFADIVHTIRDVAGNRIVASMIVLAGGYALLVGNAYQAQMPEFARDFGHGAAGPLYSMLLAADATGAFIAGVILETRGLLPPRARTACILAMLWCCAIAGFAAVPSYPAALLLLFAAGFLELSFSSMAQALVQIHAPAESRGRIIGLYGMGALGLRAFSGVTVGVMGGILGIHWSLAVSAGVLFVVITSLLTMTSRPAAVGAANAD